jgi:hypothetical protein
MSLPTLPASVCATNGAADAVSVRQEVLENRLQSAMLNLRRWTDTTAAEFTQSLVLNAKHPATNRGVFVRELDQRFPPDQGFAGFSAPAAAPSAAAGAGAFASAGAGVSAPPAGAGAAGGGVAGLSAGFAQPAAVKASPASASTANDVFMMQIPSKVKLGRPPSGSPLPMRV